MESGGEPGGTHIFYKCASLRQMFFSFSVVLDAMAKDSVLVMGFAKQKEMSTS